MNESYKVGDRIIYGNMGVCEVARVDTLDETGDETQRYYFLHPVYHNCVIYAPVDNIKVFTRPIISRTEAERLIETIPDIQATVYESKRTQDVVAYYKSFVSTHDCADLIELTMSIYAKKQLVERNNRAFGAVDKRFMHQAEDLLFGELAVALGIDKDAIQAHIASKIDEHQGLEAGDQPAPSLGGNAFSR